MESLFSFTGLLVDTGHRLVALQIRMLCFTLNFSFAGVYAKYQLHFSCAVF